MNTHLFKEALPPRCSLLYISSPDNKSRGFSLLELLISLLIFAVGFIGLASLQTQSFKITHDSILQTSAISISHSLIEQFRVKRNHFDLTHWEALIAKKLPNGTLELTNQGTQYQLKVFWRESEGSDMSVNIQRYASTFQINDAVF